MKEKYGEKDIDDMIIYFITDLVNFFNVSRTMNAVQIMQTKNLIIDCYPFFTPEDFSICFHNIKMLRYGAIYEGLDGGKIMGFIQKYEEEFMAEREAQNKKMVSEKRETFKNEMQQTGELLLPVLKSVVEKLDKPKEIKPKPVREKTEAEKIMQEWIKEFDDLHYKNGQPNGMKGSIRMVKYAGKIVDINEFLNTKLDESTTLS